MKKLPPIEEALLQLDSNPVQSARTLPPIEQALQTVDTQTTPLYQQSPIPQESTPNIPYPVTQDFGQSSPYDVFSGNVNTGADIASPEGTPINFKGNDPWVVEDIYNQASGMGYIGNAENRGYGNSVLVKNQRTGEKLRLSHLQDVNPNIQIGSVIDKPEKVARTGGTGNVTGNHLDYEYYDKQGNLGDVLQTPYADIFNN